MQAALQLTALATLGLLASGGAPTPAAPVSDALRSIAQRSEKNFVDAAEALPAGKYGYRPTAAQMTAGQIFLHVAQGNDHVCALIGGTAAPKRAELSDGASKPQVVARLKESFEFCQTMLAKVNDSKLGTTVSYFGSEITQAQAMLAAAEEWGGHYSQLAVYLRLNGVLPPTARANQS